MNLGAKIVFDNNKKKSVLKTASYSIEMEINNEEREKILHMEFYSINGGKDFDLYIDNSYVKRVKANGSLKRGN